MATGAKIMVQLAILRGRSQKRIDTKNELLKAMGTSNITMDDCVQTRSFIIESSGVCVQKL